MHRGNFTFYEAENAPHCRSDMQRVFCCYEHSNLDIDLCSGLLRLRAPVKSRNSAAGS
jgi:hypothetical protein